jgi:hypothetical protein
MKHPGHASKSMSLFEYSLGKECATSTSGAENVEVFVGSNTGTATATAGTFGTTAVDNDDDTDDHGASLKVNACEGKPGKVSFLFGNPLGAAQTGFDSMLGL